MPNLDLTFCEFFAGGGMARLGLGKNWKCVFANDICEKKATAYRTNFDGAPELAVRDIRSITLADVPFAASLAWASFPCQDLSLAGDRAGLKGHRSNTFWSFWNLIAALADEDRAPRVIVLENVIGAISSNGGSDFRSIIGAIASAGYRVGALIINAVHFVPQSRPRLFIVGAHSSIEIASNLVLPAAAGLWHTDSLKNAHNQLPASLSDSWIWWNLPVPPSRPNKLETLIEQEPLGVEWHTTNETNRLLKMMSEANLKKVEQAARLGKPVIGTVYRRTRHTNQGRRAQRAEVRFDQISGCLRTPVGGSSRQTILVVNGSSVRSRLLSSREAARLMGAPESYALPKNYNEAYHLMGDAVVVPVVSWLGKHLLYPLAASKALTSEAA